MGVNSFCFPFIQFRTIFHSYQISVENALLIERNVRVDQGMIHVIDEVIDVQVLMDDPMDDPMDNPINYNQSLQDLMQSRDDVSMAQEHSV